MNIPWFTKRSPFIDRKTFPLDHCFSSVYVCTILRVKFTEKSWLGKAQSLPLDMKASERKLGIRLNFCDVPFKTLKISLFIWAKAIIIFLVTLLSFTSMFHGLSVICLFYTELLADVTWFNGTQLVIGHVASICWPISLSWNPSKIIIPKGSY